MRLSSLVLVVVAGLMGLGAAFLATNWLEQQRGMREPVALSPAKTDNMRKVVVAGEPLRFGTEITAVNLKEVEWPAGAVPDGSFTTIAELTKADERRVALAAIEPDEPILAWKVTGPGQRGSLSAVISSGKQAVTIRVNDVSGAAGFVLPGDRVDVLLTRSEDQDKSGYTDVLLQNIRTLAVDQLADERSDKPSVVKAVTLEVSTVEAQKLALAQIVGQLSLALRPAGATSSVATHRVGVSDLAEADIPHPSAALASTTQKQQQEPASAVIGVTRAIERKEYNVKPEGSWRVSKQ